MKRATIGIGLLLALGCDPHTTESREASSALDAADGANNAESAHDGDNDLDLEGEPAELSIAGSDVGFGPIELACENDADCDITWGYYMRKDGKHCCRGCSARVGQKSALAREERICRELSMDGCPMKKCAGIPGVSCRAGRCTANDR